MTRTYNANNMRHTAADRSQRRIPKMIRINMLLANTFEQFTEQFNGITRNSKILRSDSL